MKLLNNLRLLIGGLVITGLLLLSFALMLTFTSQETASGEIPPAQELLADLSDSDDECVVCHINHTPGIVNQYVSSDHFANNVSCANCHEVEEDYPGGVQHPEADFWVLPKSSPAQCETCHKEQVQQFNLSRHALPSYTAYAGTESLSEAHKELLASIPEALNPSDKVKARNAIHGLEGLNVTRFTCEGCHDVGKPNPDQSIGDCTACHLRHEFSLEQSRKPETCGACHIGPDHPQWEIYQESPHGVAYLTGGDDWNWEGEPGTLTTADFPAPTCATCHFSGFGGAPTTHDVGDRLGWFLADPISKPRPNFAENRIRMQNVCAACHSDNFVAEFYVDGDLLIEDINAWVMLSDAMMQPLKDAGLVTAAPFDEPIDYVYYEIWHHWGRTAKSGSWMQGPDYAQWHGVYEILKDLAHLRELIDQKLEAAGLEPLDLPETFPSIDSAREYLASLEAASN
jgi:hypothetical protein